MALSSAFARSWSSATGYAIEVGKLRPGIGAAHVHASDGLNSQPGRLDPEELGRLAGLDTTPELPLSCEEQVLIERIGRNGHFDPFAAARNDGKDRRP